MTFLHCLSKSLFVFNNFVGCFVIPNKHGYDTVGMERKMSKNLEYQCDFCPNKILDDGMGSSSDYPFKIYEIKTTPSHICSECFEDDKNKRYGVSLDSLEEITF